MNYLLRKLVVGVIIVLTTSIIMAIPDPHPFGAMYFIILYTSPVVLLFGTLASYFSDFLMKKLFHNDSLWPSLFLHSLLALLIMLGFILYFAAMSGDSYLTELRVWRRLVIHGVVSGFSFAILDYLFKRTRWFTPTV